MPSLHPYTPGDPHARSSLFGPNSAINPPQSVFSFSTPVTSGQSSRKNSNEATAAREEPAAKKDAGASEAEAKRRKIQRACDICRRKKIKCEGPMNAHSTSRCAHCDEFGYDCTYIETAKRRGPPKGYVEMLEQRCTRLEKVLDQLHPSIDISSIVGPVPDRDAFDLTSHQEALHSLQIPALPAIKPFTSPSSFLPPAAAAPSSSVNILGSSPWKKFEQDPNRPPPDPDCELQEANMHVSIAQAMNKLDIKDESWRFHGKASVHHLIMILHQLRADRGSNMLEGIKQSQRAEYWQVPEWERVIAMEGLQNVDFSIWPEPDLAQSLIDAYFEYCNVHFPLLNRLIYRDQYDSGLYSSNREFAKVCLMVFANGARFVDDDRVYWPKEEALTEEGKERMRNDTDGTLKYSSGWKYTRAFMRMGRSLMQGPNLFDFQCHVLMCTFLHGSAVPHLTWIVSGYGLRAAQEIGIHVRSILLHADPTERALYGRAFWCLYHIDRINCAAIGRSVAIQDTDFDADYPIIVDDEHWETGDPARDFVQPPGTGLPDVAAFVHLLKLDHVIGAALRTIYAINKLPELSADPESQRAVVVELDSALNSWADAVPDGLRWDPTRTDPRLFIQSASLYVHYYFCQIMVHRPLILTPSNPDAVCVSSMAVCSNAARSISNIIDAVMRRARQAGVLPGRALPIQFMLPAWIATVVILISVYSGKQPAADRERSIGHAKKCLAAMKDLECTWRQAGKLTDVMSEITRTVEYLPSDIEVPARGKKRTHEAPPAIPNSEPPSTPPPLHSLGLAQPADLSLPIMSPFNVPTESLFDTTMFEPFFGNLGDLSGSEMPQVDGEADIWAQLFGNRVGTETSCNEYALVYTYDLPYSTPATLIETHLTPCKHDVEASFVFQL